MKIVRLKSHKASVLYLKFLQRVRFWIEKNTTRQFLNKKNTVRHIFKHKIQRVIFLVEIFTMCQILSVLL